MSVRRSMPLLLAALWVALAGCGQVSRPIEMEEPEAFAPAAVAAESPWSVETIDVAGWPYGPVAMTVGSDGARHIAFVDAIDDVVRYVSGASGAWSVAETVGPAQIGYVDSESLSIAVGPDGVPRIGYLDRAGALAYAARTDGAWPLAADVVSPYANLVSVAVDADGVTHLLFKDGSGLRHAVQTSDGWSISTVFANPASGGVGSGAVALDAAGRPRVALVWNEFVYPTFYVRLGYIEGAYDADGRIAWSSVTVVATYTNATTAGSVALALDDADRPRIAHRSGFGQLLYVAQDGSAWGTPELVDAADSFAPTLAVDGSGNAHVAYLVRPPGTSTDVPHYAVRGDAGWRAGVVDDAGDAGAPALVVDALDRPYLGYAMTIGTTNTLRYATVADPVTGTVVTNGLDDGPGSLRAVVLAAPAGATITFASDVTEVVLTSGSIVLERDVTIAGPEGGTVTLRGNDTFPIVRAFTADIDLVLRDLTIRDGFDSDVGGGVRVGWPGFSPSAPITAPPSLRLERCTVVDNYASYGGGGVYVEGDLVLEATTVRGNAARDYGGGVHYVGTDVNAATPYASTATLINATITGNTAGSGGGGVFHYNGVLRVVATTITGNATTVGDGGGVFSFNDDLTRATVKASVVVGNTGPMGANDVYAVHTANRFDSLGYNVIGAASGTVDFGLEFNATGDLTGVTVAEAGLAALADNGGSTWTHALAAGSVAIDHVPSAACTDAQGAPLGTDQRGVARPQGTNCDSGAFELEGGATSYTLFVSVAPADTGSVAGAGAYAPGAPATLTATPIAHWQFDHWSGAVTGTDNPVTVTMDASKSVVANFVQVLYPVTETLDGGGSVLRDPPGSAYPYGTTVTLTAVPTADWGFSYWSGDVSSPFNPGSLYVTGPMSYTAHFVRWYTLTVQTVGSGRVGVDPPAESFPSGNPATLTATADPGWSFAGWSGDLTGSTNPVVVTMDANKAITATFVQDTYTVTTHTEGVGTVLGGGTYPSGAVATLTAVPGPDARFDHWSGAASGSTNPLELTVTGHLDVTAHFVPGYALALTVVGEGEVVLDPPTGPYAPGTVVALTATPAPGWFFQMWTGSLTGSANPTALTMHQAEAVTAVFQPIVGPMLTITIDGDGHVVSEPAGLDCWPTGGACVASFPKNARVTLHGLAHEGSAVLGWTGSVASVEPDLTLRLNADKVEEAHFVPVNGPVVAIEPTGSARGSTAIVRGTLVCATGPRDLAVSIFQAVEVKGMTQLLSASTTVPGVACGQAWSASLSVDLGRFARDLADVTVTVDGTVTRAAVLLR